VKGDLVAAIVIVTGAAMLLAFGGLAPLWGDGANRPASFWPVAMLSVFAALGLTLGVQSARGAREAVSPADIERAADSAASGRGRVRNTLAVLAFVPALLLFGFYVSALAYAFLLPRLLGGVRWRASAVFAIGFILALYALFTLALGMDLPSGYIGIESLRSAIEAR